MKLRERLRQLLHFFERRLTRVEDQGVRIENGVENIQDLIIRVQTAVDDLRVDVTERHSRIAHDVSQLRSRLGVLEKLTGQQTPKH